jgi:DnaK suppressor protein
MKSKEKLSKTQDLSHREKSFLEIKRKLIQQKEVLLSGAGITRNSLPDVTAFPELADQASAEINRNFTLRLRERERKLLKKIDSAIEKIDHGTYGVCDMCGRDISIKRLQARPVTNMCIECKIEQEAEEKLREG